MSLRSRLLLTLGALLVVAMFISGVLAVGVTRASLVDRVDEQLRGARLADLMQPGPGRGRVDPTGRRIALIVLNWAGDVVEYLPSGFLRQPDPLPMLGAPGSGELPLGQIIDARAADGSLHYRVLTQHARGNLYYALAAPTRGVDEAVAAMIGALAGVGLVVLVIALGGGWLLIRRDMRPLERVTEAATRIADGDLTPRAGIDHGRGEVGRLGHAFDAMVEQIQRAFAAQDRALEGKQRSEEQLRQFVADASHELRTPLTALRGYAELYRAGGLADHAALEQAMLRIGTESRRMAELVEDLLLLARLDQGRPLRSEPVSLSALVDDAVNDARAIEPDRPIRADVQPDVVASGDEDRLRQVVGNLLTNVRVHTPTDAGVDVSLSSANGRCTVVVADHGPGIAASDAGRVFDRFYRADPARSRHHGGSGLGLSIAARIVAAHGGSISHSPTVGGGATFTVELPAR